MKKNKKGLYTTTFTYNGKRYYIRAKTQKDLFEKAAKKKRELESGLLLAGGNTIVRQWCDEWLETYKRNSVRQGSFERYQSILKRRLIDGIGEMKIKDVRPVHLQKAVNAMAGMGADTVKKVIQTFDAVFDRARANGLIPTNPAADLEMPQTAPVLSRRAITDAERKHILAVCQTHTAGLWVKTMLYCGLRPEETIPLEWRHLSLDGENPMMRIELAAEARTGAIKPPKSASGTRSIPIPRPLVEAFRAVQPKDDPLGYIFRRKDGKRHTATTLHWLWADFKKQLDISMGAAYETRENTAKYTNNAHRYTVVVTASVVAPDLVPYCLRHTYCTDLQAAGVPINVARELMGHSDISMTARIYTHSSKTALYHAAAAIDAFWGASAGATPSACDDVGEVFSHDSNARLPYINV